jgi:hypothetical protein
VPMSSRFTKKSLVSASGDGVHIGLRL